MTVAAIGAVLLAGAAVLNAAAPSDEVHVLIAHANGTYSAATHPLTGEQLANATHLWAWTDRLPPRKLATSSDVLAELRKQTARPLEVRVRGWSRAEELASVRVIAAPVEMWRTVPEPMLPSFAVSKEGRATIRVRDQTHIRVVGDRAGSMWERVARGQSAVEIVLRKPAVDAEMTFRTHDGAPAGRVFAVALSRRRGEAGLVSQAQFTSDEKAVMRIPSLPESEVIALFITSDASAPYTLSGTAADLSRTIRLPPALRIRGKFVDEENRPLTGVTVEAEGWASEDAPAATRNEAVSDESGAWAVRNVPLGPVMVRASAAGRATFRKRVVLESEDVDLGTIALARSSDVVLTVVDAADRPLPNVGVESATGFRGTTNKNGAVSITGLPADETTAITLTASGFAKQTIQLVPPLPRKERVVLERSFAVRGVVTDDNGAPLTDALIVVTTGPSYRTETVSSDGTFAFDVGTGEEFELSFESPSAATILRRESAGQAGEVRNLGTIRLPSGMTVRGRVTDAAGAPVSGARIWSVRPGQGGVVAAWVAGRVVQATSNADGAFDLRGLAAGPVLLRIDAPDFAPAWRDVMVEPNPVDVGAITLVRGSVVTVKAPSPGPAVARIDLRGQSLDVDMLTAPVIDGEARLHHVPPGRFPVTVVRGHAIVCDRRVDVRDGDDASVACPPPMRLRGRVIIGGAPAFGGSLTWLQPGHTDSLVENRISGMGARQQRVYGLGGGMVVVPLHADGTFETDQLRAGEWQVGWRSADSVGTPDRSFTIPDAAEATVVVEFDGGVIRGRVLDRRGHPVAGAMVRELQGLLHARTATDGSFTMTAVAPGLHRLQATLGGKASGIVDVNVEHGKQAPELILEIGDTEENNLVVRVVGIDGEPKPGAFVFVEVGGGVLKSLTADANGVATVAVSAGMPAVSRLAAYAGNEWAFGEWRKPDEGVPLNATVRFARTGSIEIRSRTLGGTPALLSPRVPGDLAWMLSRIGMFLAVEPEKPLMIRGLPPGTYQVSIGTDRAAASVNAGSTTRVDLP